MSAVVVAPQPVSDTFVTVIAFRACLAAIALIAPQCPNPETLISRSNAFLGHRIRSGCCTAALVPILVPCCVCIFGRDSTDCQINQPGVHFQSVVFQFSNRFWATAEATMRVLGGRLWLGTAANIPLCETGTQSAQPLCFQTCCGRFSSETLCFRTRHGCCLGCRIHLWLV